MRKAATFAVLVALAAPAVSAAPTRSSNPTLATHRQTGTPVYLGTIVATTTKNNHDTAAPFSNTGDAMKGFSVIVQCDTAAYIRSGTANTVTVTAANGLLVAANEKLYLALEETYGWIAALAVSGTSNCKVFQVL